MSFLIITTNDLPEAYFLADFLLKKKQQVSIVNIRGRTVSQKLRIVYRLLRKRGLYYVMNVIALKPLRRFYFPKTAIPFPELSRDVVKSIKQAADCHETKAPHARSTLEFVKRSEPDYVLIAGAPVLKKQLYGIAKRGALNRHLGLSPEYRGSDNPVWAMSQGDFHKLGFTIHFVSPRVDGGKVVLQRKVCPDVNKSFAEALSAINRAGSEGYVEVLDAIIREEQLPTKTQLPGGRHYPPAGLSTVHKAFRNYKEL